MSITFGPRKSTRSFTSLKGSHFNMIPKLSHILTSRTNEDISALKKLDGSLQCWHKYLERFTILPENFLYKLNMDSRDGLLNIKLAAILHSHSCGVPLVVSFTLKRIHGHRHIISQICGIYHCKLCLNFWYKTQLAAFSCDEPAHLIQGPTVELNINEAVMLIDVLHLSHKFASDEVQQIVTQLRKNKSNKKSSRLLKVAIKNKEIQNGADSFDVPESDHEKLTASDIANSFRKTIFQSFSTDIRTNLVIWNEMQLVGLHIYDHDLFYPGFFSRKQFLTSSQIDVRTPQETPSSAITLTAKLKNKQISFSFMPRGKIDNKGSYCSFSSYKTSESNPSLRYLPLINFTKTQSSKLLQSTASYGLASSEDLHPLVEDVGLHFGLQNGAELSISKIFTSGLWYATNKVEYFFAGVYDVHDQFKSAYCITWDGYLVPGVTNDVGKFVPFSKYDDNGLYVMPTFTRALRLDERIVIGRFRNLPSFPITSMLKNYPEWCCVRDGQPRSNDPDSITVFFDSTFNDNHSLNVYVGGEIGPDELYYFLGKYNPGNIFNPGGPPLRTENRIKPLLPNEKGFDENVSERFYEIFGIRVEENQSFRPHFSDLSFFEGLKEKALGGVGDYIFSDAYLFNHNISMPPTSSYTSTLPSNQKSIKFSSIEHSYISNQQSQAYQRREDSSNFIDEDEMNSFSAAGVYQNLLQLVYNNAMRKINPIGSLRSKDLIAKYFKEDTGIKRKELILPPTVKRQRFIDSYTFKESERIRLKYENAIHISNPAISSEDTYTFKSFLPIVNDLKEILKGNHLSVYSVGPVNEVDPLLFPDIGASHSCASLSPAVKKRNKAKENSKNCDYRPLVLPLISSVEQEAIQLSFVNIEKNTCKP